MISKFCYRHCWGLCNKIIKGVVALGLFLCWSILYVQCTLEWRLFYRSFPKHLHLKYRPRSRPTIIPKMYCVAYWACKSPNTFGLCRHFSNFCNQNIRTGNAALTFLSFFQKKFNTFFAISAIFRHSWSHWLSPCKIHWLSLGNFSIFVSILIFGLSVQFVGELLLSSNGQGRKIRQS